MNTHAKHNTEQLNELLNLKEQEWRCALQNHIDTLVKELAEKDESITLEKLRFHKLKDDFGYNLKLIEDRDNDLLKYEQLFEQMKGNDNLNNKQVSEMKIKIDEFQTKFNILQKEKEEMQHHYQMRLKHYQEEMNKFYAKKDDEHQKERNEYEELKRKLQRKIRDTEEELEFEKQKLMKQLEESIKQKEQEFQIKLDQNDAEIHSYQLKVKMLSRELEMIQSSNIEFVENLENNKENVIQISKLLKEKEWELTDITNMKDMKIRELEMQLEENKKSLKWKAEEFERRYCEMEKLTNERESNMATLRTAADNQELKLHEELKLVRQEKEEFELNLKRLQWQISDIEADKEKTVDMYLRKIETLENTLKDEVSEWNKVTVAKDLQCEALEKSEDLLRKEKNKLKMAVDRLSKEVTLALDRERILENAKVQLELDWRRRYESKETELFEKHDEQLAVLTKEKEEAIHARKQMENELNRHENLIKLLEDDKIIAIKCLNGNGINTDMMFADRIPVKEIGTGDGKQDPGELQKQNIQLKEIIREMREEMEILSQQITSNTSTPNKQSGEKSNYVKDLEVEIQDLKAANRNLLLKVEDLTKDDKPPLDSTKSKVKISDAGIKSHIKELNETIGALRNDKVLISATLNSKDATINHLNETIAKLTNEKEKERVLIDNLKYDMTSKAKVYEQSNSSLKNRISELELHLQQARSEAEVYYKSVMERNSDATQANNRLSDLKIQQSGISGTTSTNVPLEDTKSSTFYKEKLKMAVGRIKELSVERSQLINVGNKLRAELAKLKDNHSSEGSGEKGTPPSLGLRQYGNEIQSKLEKLEQFNYEAITTELKKRPKKQMDANVRLMSSSTDISEIVEDDPENDHPVKDSNNGNRIPSPIKTSSEHSSINEIWKLLENAEEISLPESNCEKMDELALVGKHINPDGKKTAKKSPVLKPKKLGKGKKRPMIRNYNQKNDN